MSGGEFEYIHNMYEWNLAIDRIEEVIEHNKYAEYPHSKKVIEELKKSLPIIKNARMYLKHIDYLLCDDHGDDSFIEAIEEEIITN